MNETTLADVPCSVTDQWMNENDPIAAYRGNPLIGALGPVLTHKQAIALLRRRPAYDESEKKLPAHLRPHAAFALRKLFVPTPTHVKVVEEVGLLIRQSYAHRNPLLLANRRMFAQDRLLFDAGCLPPERCINIPQLGTAATGTAGTGKTMSFDIALSEYPLVLEHRYRLGQEVLAFKQVVYLKINLFQDASLKALGIEFFERLGDAVGEPLREDWGVDLCNRNNIQPLIYRACREFHVGMIVIDEIQNIESLHDGYKAALRYFTRMMNCLGVAVAIIGTSTARTLMNQDLAASRRFIGSIPAFAPFADGPMWNAFLAEVTRYQYVSASEPIKKLEPVIQARTGRVPDLVVKLYLLAQMRLFGRKNETLTTEVLNETADDLFYMVKDRLSELKGEAPESPRISGVMKQIEQAFREIAKQEAERNGAKLPPAEEPQTIPVEITAAKSETAKDDMILAGKTTNVKAALAKLGVLEGKK